jgi:hypothetical protein
MKRVQLLTVLLNEEIFLTYSGQGKIRKIKRPDVAFSTPGDAYRRPCTRAAFPWVLDVVVRWAIYRRQNRPPKYRLPYPRDDDGNNGFREFRGVTLTHHPI